MFDLRNDDKIKAWREFRDGLETSNDPMGDVAHFWGKAPYVSNYLNPYNPQSWPDPWKLVINGRYDLLAISLGICYTFELTERFSESTQKVYMSIEPGKENKFMSVIDDQHVLNLHHGFKASISDLPTNAVLLWENKNQS